MFFLGVLLLGVIKFIPSIIAILEDIPHSDEFTLVSFFAIVIELAIIGGLAYLLVQDKQKTPYESEKYKSSQGFYPSWVNKRYKREYFLIVAVNLLMFAAFIYVFLNYKNTEETAPWVWAFFSTVGYVLLTWFELTWFIVDLKNMPEHYIVCPKCNKIYKNLKSTSSKHDKEETVYRKETSQIGKLTYRDETYAKVYLKEDKAYGSRSHYTDTFVYECPYCQTKAIGTKKRVTGPVSYESQIQSLDALIEAFENQKNKK